MDGDTTSSMCAEAFLGEFGAESGRGWARTQEICCQWPHMSQKMVRPSSSVKPHIQRISPVSTTGSTGMSGTSCLTGLVSGGVVADGEAGEVE